MGIDDEDDADDLSIPAGDSKTSEHQRRFERITTTLPPCSDPFNPLIVVRHRHVLEDIPKPCELCRVSGRNGGQFTRQTFKRFCLIAELRRSHHQR